MTLDLHSNKSYLLQRKIIFCEGNSDTIDSNRIGVVAMKSLSDDPESLCRELESHFNTVFTTEILTDSVDSANPTDVRKRSEVGKMCPEFRAHFSNL